MFCMTDTVMHLWVNDGMLDLFCADVGRLDMGKIFGERNCRLSIAGGAVPGRVMPVTNLIQIGKQIFGILWSMFGVLIRTLGKGLNVVQ